MGPLSFWVRLRAWVALRVVLPVLYWVLGERPVFCDMADDCPYGAIPEDGDA